MCLATYLRTWLVASALTAAVSSPSALAQALPCGCDYEPYDSGQVEVSRDVALNVITFGPMVFHNHWNSGGSFTVTETASTQNSWSVGAEAGFEVGVSAEVKAAMLVKVTAEAKVHVTVNGELTGQKMHEWAISDTCEKQSCKCPIYKASTKKPTVTYMQTFAKLWFHCQTHGGGLGEEIIGQCFGTAVGDDEKSQGVTDYYTYKQSTDACKDCYGTGGTCPGN